MNQTAQSPSAQKYNVPSVDRACRMIQRVCEAGGPLHLRDLTDAAQTSRTTALRISESLIARGFLDRCRDGRFSPGRFLKSIGQRSTRERALRERVMPILETLAGTTLETAHFAVPQGLQCVLEGVAHSPRQVRVASQQGSPVDYYCSATGKCILAMDTALTNELRERLKLKTRTPHTIGNWSALDPELAGIRQRGYAVDEQEYHLGVRCIAIPLLDHAGLVLGALGLTGATRTLTKARLPELAGILQTARERLLEDL